MLLGIDLGTSNVKALVTTERGEVLAQSGCPIALHHVENGGVEQDLEEIWSATLSAIRQATSNLDAREVQAMGISSQGGALQLLDADRKPLGRVISWLDRRGRKHDAALTSELGEGWFTQRIGHGGSGVAIGQLLRLRREAPGRVAPSNSIGFVGDCVVGRLCGHAAHDGTSAGLTLLYNPVLNAYDPDVLGRVGIAVTQLPELISPRVAAGGLAADAARATGLQAGIPVSVAIHDQYTAALGTGAVRPGTTMIGAGTAWVLLAVSDRPARPAVPNAFSNRHVIEGLFGQIMSLGNGGSALTWALQLLGAGALDSTKIDELIEAAPAGSDGVYFWPFLAPATPASVPVGTRGRWDGLQLSHGRAQLVRSVVEGLAFELKRHLLLIEGAGTTVRKMVVGGTAAASRVTPQLLADVTGLPLTCFKDSAGSALGACIIARGLQQPDRSLADLTEEMLPQPSEVQPGPNASVYAKLFEQYMESLLVSRFTLHP